MKNLTYVLKKGSFVVSLTGHDEGRTYVVTEVINSDFVMLADGTYHKLKNPKRKRIKHIKNTGKVSDLIAVQKFNDNNIHAEIINFGKSGK
ncbi:MAG: KOW domain-containing RNA-binding protein [Christensenellaceae bacterium]|jgi:ribosomal protein L14E/L6E/L27E|nr:KOW domain-containing RNA-binding protein [Christensenellaceae bacterium]